MRHRSTFLVIFDVDVKTDVVYFVRKKTGLFSLQHYQVKWQFVLCFGAHSYNHTARVHCGSLVAADDHQALIWDIQQMPRAIEDPILAYTAGGEINQIQWSSTQPDWIAICYGSCLEILRV